METLFDDILNVKKGIIVHQVNCRGVMGAGLALQLRKKWPKVYEDYIKIHRDVGLSLGMVIYSKVEDGLYVASLCGQQDYGAKPGYCYTDYAAVDLGFTNIAMKDLGKVHIPYLMSCGLAGGTWSEILRIVNVRVPDVVIVQRKGGYKCR